VAPRPGGDFVAPGKNIDHITIYLIIFRINVSIAVPIVIVKLVFEALVGLFRALRASADVRRVV
jgi:hypothetical protein